MQAIVDYDPSERSHDRREARRAMVCTSVIVRSLWHPPTEHVSYDLSQGGIRLCGVPAAQVGAPVTLLLLLDERWVRAEGRVVRWGRDLARPEFAVSFGALETEVEDRIQHVVAQALAEPERPSLLLVRTPEEERLPGWRWLQPVAERCATAFTTLAASECMAQEQIEIGIFAHGAPNVSYWPVVFPEVRWRTIDQTGRLHAIEPAED